MELYVEETHCCGVQEIAGLCDYPTETVALEPALHWHQHAWADKDKAGCTQLLFMDVRSNDSYEHPRYDGTAGERLQKFIEKNELGTVVSGPWSINPHHNGRHGEPVHRIKTFIWTLNKQNYLSWAKQQDAYKERCGRTVVDRFRDWL